MSEVDFRKPIIQSLEIIQNNETNKFKARAYKNVIEQLRVLGKPVKSMEDLENIKGIGESIREKIKEIISTGTLEKANELSLDKNTKAISILTGIYGIGPTKAKELIDLGIYTVSDLRSAVSVNLKLLNDKQKIGLTYYEDLIQRIPRKEMIRHQKVIQKCIENVNNKLQYEIVGSFRRGAESSGDIDILITGPSKEYSKYLTEVISKMITKQYIIEVLAIGDKKFMGICNCCGTSRRIDILFTPPEEYPFAILYFTGSQEFNIKLRQKALDLGWSINEHRIINVDSKKDREPPIIKSEKDIFDFLEVKYIEPSMR